MANPGFLPWPPFFSSKRVDFSSSMRFTLYLLRNISWNYHFLFTGLEDSQVGVEEDLGVFEAIRILLHIGDSDRVVSSLLLREGSPFSVSAMACFTYFIRFQVVRTNETARDLN